MGWSVVSVRDMENPRLWTGWKFSGVVGDRKETGKGEGRKEKGASSPVALVTYRKHAGLASLMRATRSLAKSPMVGLGTGEGYLTVSINLGGTRCWLPKYSLILLTSCFASSQERAVFRFS